MIILKFKKVIELNFILYFMIVIISILFFVSKMRQKLIKLLSFYTTLSVFIYFMCMYIHFDKSVLGFFYLTSTPFDVLYFLPTCTIGVDGISLFFILLTSFIFPLIILLSWNSNISNIKIYFILLLVLEWLLLLNFLVLDILYFFIFFEALLPPMFILIGYWGARRRKIKAAYYSLFYTIFGSIFMLFGILLIYSNLNTTDLFIITHNSQLSFLKQGIIWVCFFIAFSIKIPIVPFHIWLPEAHVEAPTVGSVLLASLLLKVGGYGLLRFLFFPFSYISVFFKPVVYSICVISIIYASIIAIRQVDLKRIIAYSSVAHMNFALIGLSSLSVSGIEGGLILMIGHGFISSALFILVGVLYERYHVRSLKYYSGLGYTMPLFSFFLFFLFYQILVYLGQLILLVSF